MNFFVARFSNGGAKVRIIFYFPNLFAKFFKLFFCASLSSELFTTRFSNWDCKGTTFLFTSKFIPERKLPFCAQNQLTAMQSIERQKHTELLHFC